LPFDNWTYSESLQQNEMFLLGLNNEDATNAMQTKHYGLLSKYLYRVQKLSVKGNGQIDLWFRHHLETELIDSNEARISKRFYNIQSIGAFEKLNPIKISISRLGELKILGAQEFINEKV
jgi:CRISPR-associated endonuclease Csn1